MRDFFVYLWVVLGFLPFLLNAEIVLQHPAQGEVISTTEPTLKAFLKLPQGERRAYFADQTKRKRLRELRDAQPYPFQWLCTEGESGKFTVVISEQEDFSVPSPALVLPLRKPSQTEELTQPENQHGARVSNFLLGRTYYWKIVCTTTDGKKIVSSNGCFKTDALPPRLLTLPNVGNVRDLGGWQGLGGKRVRQGLIFRSEGLNNNSPDFDWNLKKWKKEKIEECRIGTTKLTPNSVTYINHVLRWKTDLDLRSHEEVASMHVSPAGAEVRWVHIPSRVFGEIFGTKGCCTGAAPEATAKSFRVFCDRTNYPVVFHCIAGSSRTGTLAFVLNGLLGVDQDDLDKDWQITANETLNYEKRFTPLLEGFDAFGAPDIPLHKRIEAYLLKLGILPEEIEEFRAIMLEK